MEITKKENKAIAEAKIAAEQEIKEKEGQSNGAPLSARSQTIQAEGGEKTEPGQNVQETEMAERVRSQRALVTEAPETEPNQDVANLDQKKRD